VTTSAGESPGAVDPASQSASAEPQPGWRAASRDVAIVAVLAVVAILALAAVTSFLLPEDVQRAIHTPLVIGILVVGTGWVLYRIARPGR
jgi:hypothetical protein